MIQFQPSTVSGNTMAVDPNATLFNLYDNDAGVYLAGGQQDTDTVAGWLALYPFLAVEALDQLRIGVGLAPGGNSANTPVINSLDVTTAAVPEPISLALLGIGLAGLGFSRRRKTA